MLYHDVKVFQVGTPGEHAVRMNNFSTSTHEQMEGTRWETATGASSPGHAVSLYHSAR